MLIFRKHSPKKLGKDNTCWLKKEKTKSLQSSVLIYPYGVLCN